MWAMNYVCSQMGKVYIWIHACHSLICVSLLLMIFWIEKCQLFLGLHGKFSVLWIKSEIVVTKLLLSVRILWACAEIISVIMQWSIVNPVVVISKTFLFLWEYSGVFSAIIPPTIVIRLLMLQNSFLQKAGKECMWWCECVLVRSCVCLWCFDLSTWYLKKGTQSWCVGTVVRHE